MYSQKYGEFLEIGRESSPFILYFLNPECKDFYQSVYEFELLSKVFDESCSHNISEKNYSTEPIFMKINLNL